MNETDVILKALRQTTPLKKRKRMYTPEIEPSPICSYDEVIARIGKKTRKPLKRNLSEWTNADFMRYLQELFSVRGMELSSVGIRDREIIGKTYDSLAHRLKEEMSNEVLRDYFDWWITSYGSLDHRRQFSVYIFLSDRYIDKFVRRFGVSLKPQERLQERPQEVVDNFTLYKMGGLPLLLMSKGIVQTCSLLKERNEKNIFTEVVKTMQKFSKDTLLEIMEITLKGAPYPRKDEIDFISLARPVLEFYGLKKFINIKYQEYFE